MRQNRLLVRSSDSEALAGVVVVMIENYSIMLRAAELRWKKLTDDLHVKEETEMLNMYP